MKYLTLMTATLALAGSTYGLTRREVFSNSAVHLSQTCADVSGSGFVFFRPADPSNEKVGKAFLATNKHVIPPEGAECGLEMRVAVTDNGAPSVKAVTIPVVGKDGKYLDTVRLHRENDIAAINVTPQVVASGMALDFVPVGLLGTKARLKGADVALAGDEIYMIGYPAGIYDKRNALPVWRVGIIATSPLLGYSLPDLMQKTFKLPAFIDGFLIDAHVYPGSSGSAVVVKPGAISFDAPSGLIAGGPRSITYVLGLISDSIPMGDFGGKVPTRIGIGIVQSADAISETIEAFFKK
jgi:S1-C subfamily serine protease